MPKFGREHRASELSETIRYMRGCGSGAYVSHQLQDIHGGHAHGGDFLALPNAAVVGIGTHRTNRLCAQAIQLSRKHTAQRSAQKRMKGSNTTNTNNPNKIEETMQGEHNASRDDRQIMNVATVQLDPQSPPLTDLISFAGQRTLLVQESACGLHAVQQIVKKLTHLPWQVLRIEPQCSVISHVCGVNYVYDVLCDDDFTLSMNRLGQSGLNPFPVAWSEPRKLGISMRSVCLIGRFTRGTLHGGGGLQNRVGHVYRKENYNPSGDTRTSRLFAQGHRIHNDVGSPLFSQIACGEIPTPTFQPVPRYFPPMHRSGGLVVSTTSEKSDSSGKK